MGGGGGGSHHYFCVFVIGRSSQIFKLRQWVNAVHTYIILKKTTRKVHPPNFTRLSPIGSEIDIVM